MAETQWTEIFTGPRSSGFPTFIRNLCWQGNLSCEMEVDKGWFRETVRVKIRGEGREIDGMRHKVHAALKTYNSRTKEVTANGTISRI